MFWISAELQNVPLADADVLQQLPQGMLRALRFLAAKSGRQAFECGLEIDVRVTAPQQFENMAAERVGFCHGLLRGRRLACRLGCGLCRFGRPEVRIAGGNFFRRVAHLRIDDEQQRFCAGNDLNWVRRANTSHSVHQRKPGTRPPVDRCLISPMRQLPSWQGPQTPDRGPDESGRSQH